MLPSRPTRCYCVTPSRPTRCYCVTFEAYKVLFCISKINIAVILISVKMGGGVSTTDSDLIKNLAEMGGNPSP